MANSALIGVVETVVDDKVAAGEMFTAHDITIEVRTRGHRAGHNEVRDAVHDYYGRGGLGVAYSRTTISVPGGNPFLYHRGADDPSTYANIRNGSVNVPSPSPSNSPDDDDDDDDSQPVAIPAGLLGSLSGIPNGQPASVAGVAVATATRRNSANKPGVVVARRVDGRDTLSIPTTIIRAAGFSLKQKVFAVASTSGVDIIATQPPASAVFGKYTVDSHGQVRLTQSLLQRAGIGGKEYDVENGNNNTVKVKLHQ